MPITPEAQVRLLIADPNGDDALFSSEDLQGFLAINGDVVLLAAADALDAIATSEVLISKVIRTQDRQTDGAKVADAVRKHAASLRARWQEQIAGEDESFFMVSPGPSGRAEGEEWK